jgi:hypothetical protein
MKTATHARGARGRLAEWLGSAPGYALVLYAVAASFSTYFCMYAFRKPFAVGQYEGLRFLGMELKTALVISQIVGYTLSKYIGIKVCSEAGRGRRAVLLVFFILWAEAALVLFAVVPPGLKVFAIFLNGLPLGMVWGLVVWYLEGRRSSELLLAGLSCSFIVGSAATKDIGKHLMNVEGVGEWWMPAVTGLCFLPLFLASVWLLNQIPPPSAADIEARAKRETMDGAQRASFVRTFLVGLVLLLISYFFLTAYRDFRDNYGAEILKDLGLLEEAAIFTRTEMIVMAAVLIPLALLVLVKDNRRGLAGAYAIMTGGMMLVGLSTLLFDAGKVGGFWWITLVGIGLYLAYVPVGSVLFDRLIASTRAAGTAVFAIYLADAIGYTGSIGVQLYKDFGRPTESRLVFFKGFTYMLSVAGVLLLAASFVFLAGRQPGPKKALAEVAQQDSIA